PILIIMNTPVVEICMKTEIGGVAFPKEILAIDVANEHDLVAGIKRVQLGMGVLLAHIKNSQIVLPSIVGVVAKQASAEINVVENKSAKITPERLIAETGGDEII